ncbi:DoxX family protein [Stackebrandtia nassauensis]|uniref:DoxX family protein n=1 Tax=Stackebrandtia nassauensis (strain DSM 44728 / CIP 108903 / NRRL B-16338 / NBRC 102104 / LLR-40K-21) TaxID=446470 RepID=D3PUC2_STANL|nr:DoxX family protein [Stackebrandtia nassauensis]ADD41068.1 conserved hypothetical protein [Stackebrandtia nassauensis DSM 44728]
MNAAYLTLTLITAAANLFSGGLALAGFAPIYPAMAKAGVPASWVRFPIGTLKTAGALGLLAGLWLPMLGTAAAIGLVLFFVCAIHTHLLARDRSPQLALAVAFLTLAVATLTSGIATGNVSECH